MTSRAITKEEAREVFLSHVQSISKYWAGLPDQTDQERCDGVAFSILCIFDGVSGGLPAFDAVIRPHPEDKQYNTDIDENYYENGMAINDDVHLHEIMKRNDSPSR